MKSTLSVVLMFAAISGVSLADDAQPPVSQRFADAAVTEEPNFQKHIVPLFGRLGCNGRACHGSFQGAGEFRLSLFGYDFKFDHDALTKKDEGRVNTEQPLESLILTKPVSDEDHEGGQRFETGSWQYQVLRRWIEGGAKFDSKDVAKLAALEVTPNEIVFAKEGDAARLKAVAVWADGTREDVTPLCRFTSNSDQIARITIDGIVSAAEPGDTHVVVSYDKAVITVPVLRPVSDRVGEKYPAIATKSKLDELVMEKLRKLGVVPSEQAGDAEFLRRVSLDVAGTLPTAKEVEEFVASTSPNKRSEKIDELLATSAYAAWWTTKFCDWTGNNDQQLNNASPVRGKPGQEWFDWIYKRVSENTPYDELAAGIVMGQSRRPGESYTEYCEEMSKLYTKEPQASFADRPTLPHYWARTNFRLPEDRAISFAYTFLGVRIQCAQCHKHPFDTWSKQDFEDFKGFFSRVNFNRNAARENKDEYEQIMKNLGFEPNAKMVNGKDVYREFPKLAAEGKVIPFGEVAAAPPRRGPEPKKGKDNGKPIKRPTPMQVAKLLGTDEPLNLNEFADARTPLMDWLRSPSNPYFARAFVNRVWASYFNVGIVEPPDDMSLGNPPSNKPLLDYLAQGFIEHKFDIKWLHREILNSETYQRSWRTNETNAKDDRNFSHSVPRRLAAEVAYDAIQRATASDERASSMLSDLKDRGIAVATSNANANAQGRSGFALKVFGRSTRESNCDCDRTMEASLLQTVYLQNDSDVIASLNPTTRGTWLAEVNAKFNPPAKKNNDKPGRNEEQRKRELARVQAKLAAARKQGDEQQVARIEARIKEMENAKAEEPPKEEPKAAEPPAGAPTPAELVRQAYLRTLTREPNEAELDRSLKFVAEANSPVSGVRDLMWALLNTKEFIVNH